jgi:hypothetical protein
LENFRPDEESPLTWGGGGFWDSFSHEIDRFLNEKQPRKNLALDWAFVRPGQSAQI